MYFLNSPVKEKSVVRESSNRYETWWNALNKVNTGWGMDILTGFPITVANMQVYQNGNLVNYSAEGGKNVFQKKGQYLELRLRSRTTSLIVQLDTRCKKIIFQASTGETKEYDTQDVRLGECEYKVLTQSLSSSICTEHSLLFNCDFIRPPMFKVPKNNGEDLYIAPDSLFIRAADKCDR